MNAVVAILQILIIVVIAAAFARRVLARREPEFASTAERLVFEVAVGLGMLGLLIFALGAVQLLCMPALLGLLVAVAAFSWRELSAVFLETLFALRGWRRARWSARNILAGAILSGIGLFSLIAALAPPVAGDWDSLAYHLAIPKLFLAHHGIYYIPFSSHSNFPFTWEMLYTLGLGLGSVPLAKLFHLTAAVLLICGIWSFTKRHLSAGLAALAALIAAGIPLVAYEATTAYIDVTSALFALLVVYALTNWSATGDKRWVWTAGIAAGLAAGVKLTGLAMPLIAVVWILWPSSDQKPYSRVKLAAALAAIAFVLAAPWYVKSLIYTGNPVYPFFYGLFGGRNWSAETAALYRADQLMFGMGRDQTAALMLPWNLTFHFARFVDYAARLKPQNELPLFTGNVLVWLSSIGPVFLAALPALLISLLRKGKHRPLIVISILLVAIWFFSMQNTRYLLPALGILAPAAAYAVGSVGLRKLAYIVAGVSAAFTLMLMVQFALPTLPDIGRNEPIARADSFALYRACRFIDDNLPANAGVAMFGETRGFYLNRQYMWADPGHNALVPYARMGTDSGKLLDWLKADGYSYVLVNHANFPYYGNERPPAVALLVGHAIGAGLQEVYSTNPDPAHAIVVYEIVPRPAR